SVKDRQRAASQSTLLSGNHGSAVERLFQNVGGTITDTRQIEDVSHWRGDAEVDSFGLWSS
ncbi:MAG: hypothetical protein M3367_09180, partial [Acidobacteriota bacterium]|nr:hypothetical protein [Acidobacteriota bacterium]